MFIFLIGFHQMFFFGKTVYLQALYKKRSFPLRIPSGNMTKSAENFFVQ